MVDNIANALCMNYVDTTVKLSSKNLNIMLVHIAVGMGASLFVNGALVRRGGMRVGLENKLLINLSSLGRDYFV